jgi:hypothetical protein
VVEELSCCTVEFLYKQVVFVLLQGKRRRVVDVEINQSVDLN